MAPSTPSEDPQRPGNPDRDARHEPIPIESARQSRLDREVNEILSKAQQDRPLPPTPIASRRPKTPAGPSVADRLREPVSLALDTLTAVPLVTAVGFGIACAVIAPYSRLLATLFAILALGMLVLPYVQMARRSSLPGKDGPKMWRGRVMDGPPQRPRGIGERTPADKLSDWINTRRR